MKVRLPLLERLHLERTHQLLSARGLQYIQALFDALDVRKHARMDDIAFRSFMCCATDLSEAKINHVFEMFDVDGNGFIDFDEFYLLVCMLVAIKHHNERVFLSIHSRTCFALLDEDGGGTITLQEFERFGFVFNISMDSARKIFKQFDIDGSQELDYEEFRMFTLACLEAQQQATATKKRRSTATAAMVGHLTSTWGKATKAIFG
eukprot:jgi/Mesvir1/120/Mv07788-RA.1